MVPGPPKYQYFGTPNHQYSCKAALLVPRYQYFLGCGGWGVWGGGAKPPALQPSWCQDAKISRFLSRARPKGLVPSLHPHWHLGL